MINLRIRRTVRAILYDYQKDNPIFLLLLAKKGYWQNPQGGIEDGETEHQAIYAEVYEETGLSNIKVIEDTNYTIEYDALRKGEPIHVVLSAYAVKASSKDSVMIGASEDEHQGYMWVPYDVAYESLSKYPEQQLVFKEVCKRANLIPNK